MGDNPYLGRDGYISYGETIKDSVAHYCELFPIIPDYLRYINEVDEYGIRKVTYLRPDPNIPIIVDTKAN